MTKYYNLNTVNLTPHILILLEKQRIMSKQLIKKTGTDPGYLYVPYLIKIPTDRHRNKWKNFLLKIKNIFFNSHYSKNSKKYSNKKIDPSYYKKININNNPKRHDN